MGMVTIKMGCYLEFDAVQGVLGSRDYRTKSSACV